MVAVGALAACSSSASPTAAAEAKTFMYWSMWQESEPQAAVLKEALAKYQAATGVTVTAEWHGRGVFDDVAAAVKAGQPAPDLTDGSITAILGAAGDGVAVADMAGVYKQPVPGENQNLADVVPNKYIPLLTDHTGAVVMVPYEVASEAVFFDKTRFPQLSANPPQTWDDFLAALNTVKAKGEPALALDPAPGNCASWVEWMFERELGPGQFKRTAEELDPTHVDGVSRWDDSRLLDGAKKLEALIKGGYFAPGSATEDVSANSSHAKDQENNWAAGKVAMILGGTWTPSENQRTDGVDSFLFPSMPEQGGVRLDDSAGVDFSGFAVPKAAKNSAAAEKFILYFMNKDRLAAISTEAGNMTPRTDIDAPKFLGAVQLALTNRTVFADQDALMRDDPTWYTTVFQKDAVEFMTGKASAPQFLAKLKADSGAFWRDQSAR